MKNERDFQLNFFAKTPFFTLGRQFDSSRKMAGVKTSAALSNARGSPALLSMVAPPTWNSTNNHYKEQQMVPMSQAMKLILLKDKQVDRDGYEGKNLLVSHHHHFSLITQQIQAFLFSCHTFRIRFPSPQACQYVFGTIVATSIHSCYVGIILLSILTMIYLGAKF